LIVEAPGEPDVLSFHNFANMAYQHQQCDSYFVEDDTYITPQHAFKAGLRRQDALVGELNRQANDTYGDDMAAHMLTMEVNLTQTSLIVV
jgi:hypothetical protein